MKLMPALTLISMLGLSASSARAQTLQTNGWNNFEGKLGNSEMQLSLYLFKDGSIKGNYFLKYTGPKMQLEGQQKGKSIVLREMVKNMPWGSFNGKYSDTANVIAGSYSDSGARQLLPFSVRLVSANPAPYDQRYPGIFGTTEEIEGFMKKVVTAILINDKDWLGDHVRYPLKHIAGKGFNSINNKQQLIRYYDEVFTKYFKEKIRKAYTTNLFVRNGAVMLANGEIWVGNVPNSNKDKHSFEVIAINP